jgi:HAD superfamily hydrolase (TIGR01509 family)
MEIKRVLFDLDGTLFDTQKTHAQVESQLMAEHGVTLDPVDLTSRFAGIPTHRVFMEALGCGEDVARALEVQKWDILLPRFQEAAPLADLRALFSNLSARGVSLAIGTASPRVWAWNILNHHGLLEFFDEDSIVGGDMVANGKPAPDIWITAARDTGFGNCLVVEDGTAGVQGALAVGMQAALLLPKQYEGSIPLDELGDILRVLD